MKTLLITSSILAMLSAPAMAVELGHNLSLNSTVDATYAIEAEDYAIIYTPELSYAITDGLRTYINTDFDLEDPNFNGSIVGVEYVNAKLKGVTFSTESSFDENMDYTDTVVEVELKF